MSPSPRIVGQLAVVIPTVLLSAYLGHLGMAIGPRLFLSLGFGMVLITLVAIWQRRTR